MGLHFYLSNNTNLFLIKFQTIQKFLPTAKAGGFFFDFFGEGNVEIHTNMVLLEIYKIIKEHNLNKVDAKILVLSALLHDIAKPITTKEKERDGKIRIVSPKHEIFGRNKIIFDLLSQELNSYEIITIANLVGYHNLPKLAVIRDDSLQNYKSIARATNIRLLYFLELADMRGRLCADRQDGIKIIELFKYFAQENDIFDKNPYLKEKQYLKSLSKYGNDKQDFILSRFQHEYENHQVFSIEEMINKMYDHIQEHSHLIVLSAVSGSGKSTYADRLKYKDYTILSLDKLREDKSVEDKQIRSIMKSELKVLLANKKDVVIDTTNYRKDFRSVYCDLGFNYNAFVEIKTILKSREQIIKNNNSRDRNVDIGVIDNQMKRFELAENKECHKNTVIF